MVICSLDLQSPAYQIQIYIKLRLFPHCALEVPQLNWTYED
jgi:hypothetical protein